MSGPHPDSPGPDGRATRRAIDLRLAVPAATAWAVLAVAIGIPGSTAVVAIAAWVLTGSVLIAISCVPALRRRIPWLAIVALASCAAAVLLTSASARAPARAPELMVEASSASRYLTATAVTTQTVFAGTESFTVTIDTVEVSGQVLDVSVPARAFGESAGTELGIGTLVRLRGTLAATEPGDDIAFLLFTSEAPEALEHPAPVINWANDLRDGFRASAAALPGDGGTLLPGLAIGDTSAVPPDLDEAMKASSLSHLTAVSGANCAIVIALVMLVTARLRMSKIWRIAISLVVLAGFVVLVTPEPSVLRAAVMAVLVLISSALGRGAQGLPMLALATMILLTFDPWLARDYGFTLSVMATGGLLLLSGPITTVFARALPTPIAAALAIPLSAQLACQPVLILLAPSIPVFGVVANVLAGPAAPAATIVGLIACVLLPVSPLVGGVVAHLAWVPAAWIAATARFFADLPGSRLNIVEGWWGVGIVAVVTMLALCALLTRRRRWRSLSASVLAILVVAALGSSVGTAVRSGMTRPAEWQFAMCDVGQGDAAVVRDGSHIAVIDTGPDPELMEKCLEKLGIDRVHLLVLTHFDVDHVGGVSALIGRADEVVVGPEDRPEAVRLVKELRSSGSIVKQVHQGDTGKLGQIGWEVLWPPSRLSGLEPGNDSSVTLVVGNTRSCDDCLSALFLADLGEESQNRMAATIRIPQVDMVKVAHHGSKHQSAKIYEQASASVALIGVGVGNTYGHPTADLLDIMESTGTTVLRTDLDGLVLVAPAAGDDITVWTERGG